MRIGDVAQKTCQRRRTIGKSGERGSGISVLAARHDDDVKAKINNTQLNSKFRLYGERDEKINHVVSKCSNLAQIEYKTRHDRVER